jgi:CDP-diacylglycerol--glycerol-3-phosphate 3-phosphatidyltransferase
MSVKSLEQAGKLGSLKVHWAAFSLSGILMLSAVFTWLQASWGQVETQRWSLLSAVFFACLCFSLWRGLNFNYRAGEGDLLPTLGAGNTLTLLRGLLLSMLAGFLIAPRPAGILAWFPGLLMAAVTAADLFDGYLARRFNQATRLGEMLDMQLDGLSLLLSTTLIVLYKQAPAWFLLVGLARFLFVSGIAFRRRLGKPVFDLPPSATRRPFAGAMMGCSTVLLLPLFSPPATTLAAALFSLPFLAGFARDWLAVCGAIPSSAAGSTSSGKAQLSFRRRALLHWLPVLLRAILVSGLALKLAGAEYASTSLLERLSSPGTGLAFGLSLLAAVLVAFGAAGRFGAVCALCALGFQGTAGPLGILDLSLLTTATALFFLGSGAFSAWVPEKRLIENRLGEKIGQEA